MAEYMILSGVLIFALFVPFDGDVSVLDMFLAAIKTAFENYSSTVSVP